MKHFYISFSAAILLALATFYPNYSSAQHFQFQGGGISGQQYTLFIAGASINGEDLVAGDEIAIFDGETMVGAYTLTQVCTVENQFENMLTAYAVLANSQPGFTVGNPVTFKCWQASTETEAVVWEADWTDPFGDAWTEATFPDASYNYSLPVLSFSHVFTGTVEGLLTDSGDAQPIEGAELSLTGTEFSTISAADGTFLFEDIPVGDYEITCAKNGYFPITDAVSVVNNETTILNLSMEKILASIQGTVTSITNDPVEGATITFEGEILSTTSQADGSYFIDQIPEGDYTITCAANSYFSERVENVSFAASDTITLDFTLTSSTTQTIVLKEGYSFISSYISADEPDMQIIMEDALDNLKFVRDEQGNALEKFGPVWINGIGDWIPQHGYFINMLNTDTVTLQGTAVGKQSMVLNYGYNLFPHLNRDEIDALNYFDDVLDNLSFVRDSKGHQLEYLLGMWINGIGDMQPGEGFLVLMNAQDTIQASQEEFECGSLLYDERDGQYYETVQIGEQCWMAENLNVGERIDGGIEMADNEIVEKYCYQDQSNNCNDYGGLYQWNEMMQYTTASGVQGICPVGWHLPTDDEWKILEGTVDSQYPVGDPEWDDTGYRGFDAGLNLKSTSGWNSNGNGTDLYGFSALPGGFRGTNGGFYTQGSYGHWWSSDEGSANYAWGRRLDYYDDKSNRYGYDKGYGFSVRCLRD